MAEDGGLKGPGVPYLGQEERQMLERGKAEHRETTEATRRALAVAEQTSELAQSTLLEAHRQGQQLNKAHHHVETIHEDVREASALLKFMRRCCCFQCSDCCDPTVEQDRRRLKRMETRRADSAYKHQTIEMEAQAKQQSVQRLMKQEDAAYSGNEEAARQELFAASEKIRAARRGPKATDIGYGLPEADRQEISKETDEQDANLERIGDTVSALRTMGQELHEELTAQGPHISRLQERVIVAHDNLGGLTRVARQV